MKKHGLVFEGLFGLMELEANDKGLLSVRFADECKQASNAGVLPDVEKVRATAAYIHCENCRTQLEEYFEGKRKTFDLRFAQQGTDFQREVWQLLREIPFGKTVTYRQLAIKMGKPGAERAIGNACSKNPYLVVVPCHRVVGTNGKLTGYAAGLRRKRAMLDLENLQNIGKQGKLFG